MVVKAYRWTEGAVLEEHSRRKHKVLREYLFRYLEVRCGNPRQVKFRLALVDGFAGAGRYTCGSPGSPIIMIEELKRACIEVNEKRAVQGLKPVTIECLVVFNDVEPRAVQLLQENCGALVKVAQQDCPQLRVEVDYYSGAFEAVYPTIKARLQQRRYQNVLYNLDQCGHSALTRDLLTDIMGSAQSVEIFYTLAVEALLAFLSRTQPQLLDSQLRPFGLSGKALESAGDLFSQQAWLGAAERVVFNSFQGCAVFVSPFSIHNPDGWRYWLLHFALSHRARQVYNDVLHANASEQAHFGRSGLNMLAYNPEHEGSLYLFDQSARASAVLELLDDLPRVVSAMQQPVKVCDFYRHIYNATPAHSDDIHEALIGCEELEVLTPNGGERRKAVAISPDDRLRLRRQHSIFPLLR